MLDLNRLALEGTSLSKRKAEVAILYSATSIFWQPTTALGAVTGAQFRRKEHYLFVSEHQSAGIVSSANDGVRASAAGRATHVKAGDIVKALEDFRRKGGTVIAVGADNLAFDPTRGSSTERPSPEVPWNPAEEGVFAVAFKPG